MRMLKIFITFFLFGLFTQSLIAQSWDYEKYPLLDVEYSHLDADLRIHEGGFIEGDVLYTARIRTERTDSLRLHASAMNIILVSVNDEEKEYRMSDDELIIYLDSSLSIGDQINIRIQYDTQPGFGVHSNANGTIWTSQLPKTTRHWLPVMDHPRVKFITEFNITHPTGFNVIANGRRGSSDLISVDEEVTRFTSNGPVSPTSLAWAVGDLPLIASTTGTGDFSSNPDFSAFQRRTDPQIYLYSESGATETDLLIEAASAFQNIQQELGVNFPHRDLHIVVLEEDNWEIRPDAAGVIFVYKNRESLVQQIQLGMIGQWYGSHLQTEQWADADAINILKADLALRLFEINLETDDGHDPYREFTAHELSRWQNYIDSGDLDFLLADMSHVKNDFFTRGNNILDWQTFSQMIYEKTGRPYFEGFTPIELDVEFTIPDEPIIYSARIEWEEGENTAEVHFEAVTESVSELVTATLREETFNEVKEHEVTFTGYSDGVVVNVSTVVENITITIESRDDIQLVEVKPLYFWIYQLRNSDDVERRVQAAEAFSTFPENPDIQLALADILMDEDEPEVVAAILTSMSQLTRGASGTDDRFLRYSSSDRPLPVQKAAVDALSFFEDNERVISRLRTVILQAEDEELRRKAIHSLENITDAARFASLVQDLSTREPVLSHVPLMLDLLAEKGEDEKAVEIADTFVAKEFPYSVRKGSIDVLLKFDQSPSNWMDRLPELLADNNPLIRYQSAKALEKLNSQQRNQLVDERIDNEYDARVRMALRR
jgi:HEAT repeat protein